MSSMDTQVRAPAGDMREQLLAYWRRRNMLWLVAGVLLAATVITAVAWPPTYRSSATILIEQQEIPQELVRSVITTYADQRVQMISQRVMTSQNLMTLIDRYQLYPKKRERVAREELLDLMRNDINMKMISASVIDPRSGQPTHATIAFSVAYDSRSPDLALKVANELASLYLNENLSSRANRSRQTAAFFSGEAVRQQQRIAELDQKLAAFKKLHQEELPELVQQNIALMDRTELALHEVQDHIGAVDAQIVLLKAQRSQINPTSQVYTETGQKVFGAEDQLKNLKARLAGLKGRYAPNHPDVLSAEREIAGLEKEVGTRADEGGEVARKLADVRARLAAANQKYSADHPDVLRLQREASTLEGQLKAANGAPDGEDRPAVHPDNPAYVQVQSQIDALVTERASAVHKREELQSKLSELGHHMSSSPEVERQYREIARELESAQLKYSEVLSKQTEAQIAVNLETEQKGEKFTMIEAPQPPQRPVFPNRWLILALGFLASLGGGIAAVLGTEALDASVRGPKDVRDLLSIAPLATVPIVVTVREQLRRRQRRRYSWAGGLAALVVAVVTVHFLVAPLDVLWLVLLRRFGV